MVKQFDNCLCTNLRTGTIIIGSIELIGGLYYTITALLNISSQTDTLPGGSVSRGVQIIMGIISIILSIVLILGAVKNKHKMIYPWIMVSVVTTALIFIFTVAGGLYACVTGHIGLGLSMLFSVIIGTLIQVYCILIVNSFYITLKNGEPVATQGV